LGLYYKFLKVNFFKALFNYFIMELIIAIIILVFGVALLTKGADWLVDSSADIANYFKVPAIYVGLTIVAFGTSLPEFIVSMFAALNGQPGITLGNIVGSNIANVGLFIGITALIYPLITKKKTLKFEFPIMIVLSIVLFSLSFLGTYGKVAGAVLLVVFGAFLWYVFSSVKNKEAQKYEAAQHSIMRNSIFVALSIVMLYFGGRWFIEGATVIAKLFGMSDVLIGLTVAAVGTSAPEIFTGVAAALKKHTDLIIGNVIGSNIFNIGWVLGIVALVKDIPLAKTVAFIDIPIMIGFSVLLYIFAMKKITRTHGVVLLLLYLSYVVYLFF